MVDKEMQLDIDFSESLFGNGHERAVIPSTSSSDPGALLNSDGVYSNSHHSRVRRSSDDREIELLLEADHERDSEPLHFDESWFSNPREVHLDHLQRLGERDDMSSSSATVSVQTEVEESMSASSKGSSSNRAQLNQSHGIENNSHHSNYSDIHDGYLAASSGAEYGATSAPLLPSEEHDTDDWIIVDALETASRHCPSTPRQEAGSYVRDSFVSGTKGAKLGLDVFPSDKKPNEALYIVCLFKRRIIARDKLEHCLYIIPIERYQEIFPKIKKDEALVCHGTEFPMGEEDKPMQQCKLHRHLIIADILYVKFEMVLGQMFSIEEPCTRTVTVADIISKSNERITAGFSVKVLIKCLGGRDKLYEDSVRVTLQTGNTTLHLMFPVAYYEASISPWPHGCSVTTMPDEDRDALRSCWVDLLENIGDPISLCNQLYQYKILDADDMDDVSALPKKKERNAHVLRTIQTKGNILDFVIKVLQSKRENQGAAAILQKKRHDGADI